MSFTAVLQRVTFLAAAVLFVTPNTAEAVGFFAMDELNNTYTGLGTDPYFSPGRNINKWQPSDAADISYAFDSIFDLPANASAVPMIETALSQWSAITPALNFSPAAVMAEKDETPAGASIFDPPVFPSTTSLSIAHGAQLDFFDLSGHPIGEAFPGVLGIAEINFAYDDGRLLSADIYLNLSGLSLYTILHEVGHALGFSHTEEQPPFPGFPPGPTPNNYDPFLLNADPSQFVISPNTTDALMYYTAGSASGLSYHEVQGAIFLYGVPEPSTVWLLVVGVAMLATYRRKMVA